ncbi:hypothetical protein ACY2PI_002271 [Citrobacter amalonaticus]|uniref:hypothetical protein n=1 Tax=Citrobacter amalonaticus TaxID=35703 RepID=UPI0007338237|nr:hypothetical protein [Citrobacter amalonaticus]EKX8496290.1 hypothetical protein [Citrobacter amalonaticus]ELO0856429.1 hypothetical protein [Citrobacter amalonaticus]PNP36614.1 hypothetical protein AL525_023565 [Citrobacter amalonaticus]
MSKNSKSIITFVAVFVLFMSAYIYLYFWQIGRPVVAEWWLKNTIEKKEMISDATPGPRIVIISGSNSLFGISGDVIEKKTGMKVVNLALHASLDIDYLVYVLQRNIKKGDIVIAPLEYQYYRRDSTPTTWFINNTLAFGGDYFRSKSIIDQMKFITFTHKDRVIEGLLTGGQNKFLSLGDVASTPPDEAFSYRKYLFTSLDKYGSMQMAYYDQGALVRMEKQQKKYEEILSYGKNDLSFTNYAEAGINQLKSITEANGGQFYVTWPASINNKYFNKDDKEAQAFSNNIKVKLAAMHIRVLCDPFYANLGFKMFTDTIYHLNRTGSVIRSERLSECLAKNQ